MVPGGTFGKELGHKGGALVNEISTLIKDSQESCLTLSLLCEDTAKRVSMNQ